MARIARVVAPGIPHHVTQRGNRRQCTFFGQDDYRAYLDLMREWFAAYGVEIWAYCLMPNHAHLIAVPSDEDGLRLAIGKAHLRYSRRVNFREGWRGHLWHGRFASYPMDARHTLAAARYIELNPVRARLVQEAQDWPWSSAGAHMAGRDDCLAKAGPLLAEVGDWKEFLAGAASESELAAIRGHERTGRPLGEEGFVARLDSMLGRSLTPGKPGPRPAKHREQRK